MLKDPAEINDLAIDPDEEVRSLIKSFGNQLREIVDPEAVDRQAKADQARSIESLGGREKVIARGSFINSPVPGEAPRFRRMESTDG